jgi:hypothetical protein
MLFKEQAEHCRSQANEYAGRPEAPFLLRIASAFDELAIGHNSTAFAVTDEAATRSGRGSPPEAH